MGQKLSDKYFFEGHIMKKLLSVCVLLFVCGCYENQTNYQLDRMNNTLRNMSFEAEMGRQSPSNWQGPSNWQSQP